MASQLCIPAALLLLSLYCLCRCFTVCCFSHFQLSLKRQKKNCLRKAFFEYNITAKLACLYNQRKDICTHHSKPLVQMSVCVCTSQQCPFPTYHTIPSRRPLRKVHLLWLQSHLRFTEISGTNCWKHSSLGLLLSGAKASSWIIMCLPECVRGVFKTAGARIRAGIWLFDWQSFCLKKMGQQGRLQ